LLEVHRTETMQSFGAMHLQNESLHYFYRRYAAMRLI